MLATKPSLLLCSRCALALRNRRRASIFEQSRWQSTRTGRPLRMAVIGSGPAGFYTTYRVMSKLPNAKVDMFEQLPVPFGLVRFGVAPDHPEVKNCQDKFDEVAKSPNFRFFGNVSVGDALPFKALREHYDCVLLAYGSSKDRLLGVPGEDLPGVHSAGAFVGWYNGLPEYQDIPLDLTAGEEAVVIGQGNVALDCARILLTDVDTLRKTDITAAALEKLSKSRVRRVTVVGRRGPMQAAFTIKEVRELMQLPKVSFDPIDPTLFPPDIKSLPRAPKRIMQVLQKGAPGEAERSWALRFLLSPTAFTADNGRVSGVDCEVNHFKELPFDPSSRVEGTGDKVHLPASLVLRSIGYKSVPLQGLSDLGVIFNSAKGIVSNYNGRVFNAEKHDSLGVPTAVPGVYAAGWVKKGPTGVIASTMYDAFDTGDAIITDWTSGLPFLHDKEVHGWNGTFPEPSSSPRVVQWREWKRVEEVEQLVGSARGKPREKFTTVNALLDAI